MITSVLPLDDIVVTENSQPAAPTGSEARRHRTGRDEAGHIDQPSHTVVISTMG